MADTSTLIVREFPRTLRQQIHARAALEGRMIHEVIVRLLEQALGEHTYAKQKKGTR